MKNHILTLLMIVTGVLACAFVFSNAIATKEVSYVLVTYNDSLRGSVTKEFQLYSDEIYTSGEIIPLWVVTDACPERSEYLGDIQLVQDIAVKKLDHNCHYLADGKVTWELTLKYAVVDSVFTRKF